MIKQLPEKCRSELDSWASMQPEASVDIQGSIVAGGVLPESIILADVPAYPRYGYTVVNHKRVLVDKKTMMVMKVYTASKNASSPIWNSGENPCKAVTPGQSDE